MESYGLYNFNFSFEIWLCTVVVNCVIRLYLFLSDTRTHIIKISFINLSKKFAKEKISTMFDSFLFSIRYLYGCIEKKKNEKEKNRRIERTSRIRCPFLWHGNFGILVTPENELYHVIMVCWYKAVCRVIPCIPDLLTFDRE